MTEELERFVASLAIPADRKAVVLAELTDHVACATEAAVREGRDPEPAARAALGDLEVLRRLLEAVEPAFRVSRWHAFGRGLAASALVAFVVVVASSLVMGTVAAVAAVACVVILAPPRALELLRAELRASRIPGRVASGTPIGPALVYAFTVISAPYVIWIGMIVRSALAGVTTVDAPWSAFGVLAAVFAVLLVEGIRARREAIA